MGPTRSLARVSTGSLLVPCWLVLASAGCLSRQAPEPMPEALSALLFVGAAAPASPAAHTLETHSGGSSGAGAERDSEDSPEAAQSGEIRSIDLATALEIGGASSLQVAFAREQLEEAHARLDEAEVLWLPDLWAGVSYNKHEGALQETQGDVLRVSRNSGFAGGGLFASFDLADAMLGPNSARHEVDAASSGVTASVNDALLGIALAHNDLLEAQQRLALAEETLVLAAELVQLAEAFSRSGQGLEADAARARSEHADRRRAAVSAEQALGVQAARLATLLRLDPGVPLRAGEPRLVPLALVPDELQLDALIEAAIAARPEIRSLTSIAQAEQESERQERLRPLIPRLLVGLRGGGLGGGTGSNFEDFSEQGDLSASLVWGIRNLGLGESAVRRREAAQTRRAQVLLQMGRDAVAEQVTVAYLQAREGRRQVQLSARSVEESLRSLELNMQRIRGAEGLPIEALQSVQAAASAREAYLDSIAELNRSQLRLLRAVGTAVGPGEPGR